MKKLLWSLMIVAVIVATAVSYRVAFATSDKSDGPCTGQETAGRCADKCPNQTDTLMGYDKTTGAAICKAAPTGCPYGDSVPLGPECDKLAPQVLSQNVTPPVVPGFVGK